MSILNITLFGSMQVVAGNAQEEVKLSRSAGLLLAYLLIERHRLHSREVLAGLFWSERSQESARNCLNTTLWRLRRTLGLKEALRSPYLLTHEGDVGFNCKSDFWLDVAEFEARLPAVYRTPADQTTPEDVIRMEQSLDLYKGDLLEGVYEDWALRAREQLRLQYLNGLMYLMKYYESQEAYEQAIGFGRRILDIDPLREEIHREVIRLYVLNGQRALAVQQYEICRKKLKVELGLPPMEETQALYLRISGRVATNSTHAEERNSMELEQTLKDLRLARRSLDQASEQIRQALLFLENYVEGSH